jgi:hypothetical protein
VGRERNHEDASEEAWELVGWIGYTGIEPGKLTLRKLATLAHGKNLQQWWHTAALMSLIANCNRDPKQNPRPFTPQQFHPDYIIESQNQLTINRETMSTFAALLGVTPEQEQEAEVKAQRDRQAAEELANRQRLRIVRCA